jgi:uncharacterized membrane protein AbrB (regulator of aidB expression)
MDSASQTVGSMASKYMPTILVKCTVQGVKRLFTILFMLLEGILIATIRVVSAIKYLVGHHPTPPDWSGVLAAMAYMFLLGAAFTAGERCKDARFRLAGWMSVLALLLGGLSRNGTP